MKVENGAQDPLEERRPRVRHLRNGKTVDTLRSQTVYTAVLRLAKGRQKVLPEEPYALIGLVRDCGGGGEQSLLLPGNGRGQAAPLSLALAVAFRGGRDLRSPKDSDNGQASRQDKSETLEFERVSMKRVNVSQWVKEVF